MRMVFAFILAAALFQTIGRSKVNVSVDRQTESGSPQSPSMVTTASSQKGRLERIAEIDRLLAAH